MSKDSKLTKIELLDGLRKCAANKDPEVAHSDADHLLLSYIYDPEISAAFINITRWYS